MSRQRRSEATRIVFELMDKRSAHPPAPGLCMKIIWFIFPPARHQASCLISSFDSVNDLNGLTGWNDLNKVEIEPPAAHPRFDGATNPVDRKPSRAKHATGLIFQLRKAKE